MAQEQILLAKTCKFKRDNTNTFIDGSLTVKQTVLVFQPAQSGSELDRTYPLASITGQKKAKGKPMLMLSMQTPAIFLFNTEEDREALSRVITEAQAALEAPKPSQPAATTAAPAAGGTKAASQRAPTPPPGGARPGSAAAKPAAGGSWPGSATAAGAAAAAWPPAVSLPSAEERQKYLGEVPYLAAQYEKLVHTSTLTEEEFWLSEHTSKLLGRDPASSRPPQAKGVPNLLPDVLRYLVVLNKGQVKLHVPPEAQRQILAEKPHLKRTYMQHVPTNMSEQEFWARYFRYCKAKRKKRLEQESSLKDQPGDQQQQQKSKEQTQDDLEAEDRMFTVDAAEESGFKAFKRRVNPAVDLDANMDDGFSEGYGLAHNSARSELDSVRGYQAVTRQLAHDYNQHAQMVLQTGAPAPRAAAAAAGSGTPPGGAGKGQVAAADALEEEVQRMYKDMGVVLEDLREPVQQQFEELKVSNPRRYFSTTTSIRQQQQQQGKQAPGQPPSGAQQHPGMKAEGPDGAEPKGEGLGAVELLSKVDPLHLDNPPILPSVAGQVMLELAGLGAGEGGGGEPGARQWQHPSMALPQSRLDELRKQAMIVNELMRHFWALLPVNTEAKKKKFARLQTCMEQLCTDINTMQDTSMPAERVAMQRLLRPLRDQLDTALTAAEQVKRAMAQKAMGKAPPQQQQQQQQGGGGGGAKPPSK